MALSDSWIKAIGSVAGSLIGAGGSIAGAGLSYGQQKKLASHNAKLNYQYAEKSARNLPTWNRSGLESAGYNPMLAVSNATNGANASWTSAQSANAPDITSGISQGIANAQSFQRLKNETNTAESQVKANEATAENQSSQAMNNLEENKYIGDKRKAEIAEIQGNTMFMEAQIDNMEKQIELDRMGINVRQVANANDAERNRILEKSLPSGKSQSFKNYTDGVRNIFSGVGDVIHGRNDNYENYTETREVTNGPKGRSQEKVTSKRSGRRKKR